jgi:hypothetical protein
MNIVRHGESFQPSISIGGETGLSVECRVQRWSDGYWWDGNSWESTPTLLTLNEVDSTNKPGFYKLSTTETYPTVAITDLGYTVHFTDTGVDTTEEYEVECDYSAGILVDPTATDSLAKPYGTRLAPTKYIHIAATIASNKGIQEIYLTPKIHYLQAGIANIRVIGCAGFYGATLPLAAVGTQGVTVNGVEFVDCRILDSFHENTDSAKFVNCSYGGSQLGLASYFDNCVFTGDTLYFGATTDSNTRTTILNRAMFGSIQHTYSVPHSCDLVVNNASRPAVLELYDCMGNIIIKNMAHFTHVLRIVGHRGDITIDSSCTAGTIILESCFGNVVNNGTSTVTITGSSYLLSNGILDKVKWIVNKLQRNNLFLNAKK